MISKLTFYNIIAISKQQWCQRVSYIDRDTVADAKRQRMAEGRPLIGGNLRLSPLKEVEF